VIEFVALGTQAGFDVAQALAIGQLGKGHAEELVVAREFSDSVIALIPLNAFVEFVPGEEIQELGEDNSS